MGNVTDLRAIDCEPPSDLIQDTIDQLIELHREGRLSAVAVAMVYRDGSTGSGHSRLHSIATMIGSLARLQHRLLAAGDD